MDCSTPFGLLNDDDLAEQRIFNITAKVAELKEEHPADPLFRPRRNARFALVAIFSAPFGRNFSADLASTVRRGLSQYLGVSTSVLDVRESERDPPQNNTHATGLQLQAIFDVLARLNTMGGTGFLSPQATARTADEALRRLDELLADPVSSQSRARLAASILPRVGNCTRAYLASQPEFEEVPVPMGDLVNIVLQHNIYGLNNVPATTVDRLKTGVAAAAPLERQSTAVELAHERESDLQTAINLTGGDDVLMRDRLSDGDEQLRAEKRARLDTVVGSISDLLNPLSSEDDSTRAPESLTHENGGQGSHTVSSGNSDVAATAADAARSRTGDKDHEAMAQEERFKEVSDELMQMSLLRRNRRR